MARNCVVIMAREPRSGAVKTRLAATVGGAEAAGLYEAFLRDTIQACAEIKSETLISFADDAPGAAQFFAQFAPSLPSVPQPATGFGGRLAAAMRAGFATGCERVAIVGSDIPHIAPASMSRAFDQLDEHDVVLGPTFDGGYYLIALAAPEPALFEDIDWSSGKELAQTIDRVAVLGLSVAFTEATFDIDDIRDLEALYALIAVHGPGISPATAAAIARFECVASPALNVGVR